MLYTEQSTANDEEKTKENKEINEQQHRNRQALEAAKSKRTSVLASAFAKRSDEENKHWQEKKKHTLPSYDELCDIISDEISDIIRRKFDKLHPSTLKMISVLTSYCTLGLGHLLTPTGRAVWKIVAEKYYYFLRIIFGLWTGKIK